MGLKRSENQPYYQPADLSAMPAGIRNLVLLHSITHVIPVYSSSSMALGYKIFMATPSGYRVQAVVLWLDKSEAEWIATLQELLDEAAK